jgi:hypothetical protein
LTGKLAQNAGQELYMRRSYSIYTFSRGICQKNTQSLDQGNYPGFPHPPRGRKKSSDSSTFHNRVIYFLL